MNNKTCWVVFNDNRKNMKDAERFGVLKDVFSSVGRVYDGARLIAHARNTLQDWQEGDSLLMVGDPSLCAICLSIVLENCGKIQILRWDNRNFNYVPLELDFDCDYNN